MKIKDDVLQVLRSSSVDEENYLLYLPPQQLEKKLYTDVNKLLESINGAWNRKLKAHLFDHNPAEDLDEMILTGEWTDKKKEFQFFATPKEIVERMMLLADIKDGELLLEPSAGDGAILDRFPKRNPYIAVELMDENYNNLKGKGYSVLHGDFLEYTSGNVDKIIMNPPFTKQQDVQHIFRAWNWLSKGGRLVSIVSESPFFRENSLSKDFRDWLDINHATIINLDAGDFKSSGTNVKTRIIVVDKK